MHNILRFLGIVIISAMILLSIGSFYDLSLMKNILLICWSFLIDLLVFLIPFIIMIGCLTSISDISIYFYLHLVVVYYTIGMILSLGHIISPEHSMFNKLRK